MHHTHDWHWSPNPWAEDPDRGRWVCRSCRALDDSPRDRRPPVAGKIDPAPPDQRAQSKIDD